jgi:solute:Na+ symporter, SSS family
MGKLTIQTMVRGGSGFAPDSFLGAFGAYNAYYFAGVLFVFSAALVIAVSLMTRPPSAAQVEGLAYGFQSPEQKAENRASWGAPDVIGTAVVLSLVIGIYLYFSFWLT